MASTATDHVEAWTQTRTFFGEDRTVKLPFTESACECLGTGNELFYFFWTEAGKVGACAVGWAGSYPAPLERC
jgi:hypothetical protein